ncbi:MAG TPA: site-2 protease family protein [Anaerolineae bacterium]|nr:site-2 protease family protein [Anaerolineae bacterium]
MSWSLKLGRIFGIDIKVHLTFLLILVWGALNYGGSAGPLYGIVVTLALFTLVFLHELGHSLAAIGYGIPVKDITLLPIGGVARLERMPEKPLHELVVALAGPAVNVILAVILLPLVAVLAVMQEAPLSVGLLTQPGLLGLLAFLLTANISLAVFNMLPAFPLDGGRVLRAALGFFTNYQQATQVAVTVGRVLAIGLGLTAIFTGQLSLALIAAFIFFVGGQEGQAVAARSVLRRVRVAQALTTNTVALSPEATVGQVASLMMTSRQPDIPVLDPLSGQLLGVASRHTVVQAMKQGRWRSRIAEVMQQARSVPSIALTASLDEAQDKLTQTSSRVAAVYDGLNFRGLLSLDDIYRVFQFFSRNGASARRVGWQAG